MSRVVVKVGGSLYDLPGLGWRLAAWLKTLDTPEVILVPGGGGAADFVRAADLLHRLGEETSHWLALHSLRLTGHLLAALLAPSRPAEVVASLNEAAGAWVRGVVPVLDVYAFAREDEGRPGRLPHAWAVTSDSLAARVAAVAGADELVLLKSAAIPPGLPRDEASRRGLVDEHFPYAIGEYPIRAVNLRAWEPR